MKRVICLVPSLTETLLAAGVEVVGRTRYCIHPQKQVEKIPIVGGTKDIRWSLVTPLNADLLILDKEENPKRFAEQSPIPYVATHVTSVQNVGEQLEQLALKLQSKELDSISKRWRKVAEQPGAAASGLEFWARFPGVLRWGQRPTSQVHRVLYMIWRDPWMAAGSRTFIGSVLHHLGVRGVPAWDENYPRLELESYLQPDTLLLFSSEPYDFAKQSEEWIKFPCASALVDGEMFSWFGLRSLQFLEESLDLK
ncbi:MAG: helical backbone metal receptor [Bdellovibrionales bacterium]